MKKILLLVFSLLFVASSAWSQRTTITKFEGEDIRSLIISGAFDVKLSQGDKCSVRVEIMPEVANKLILNLSDKGCLRLGHGSDVGQFFTASKNRPVAYIVVSELDYINLSGTCSVICSGQFVSSQLFSMKAELGAFCAFMNVKASEIDISVASAAEVENLTVETPGRVLMDVSGPSRAELMGESASARLSVSSAAQLNALSFVSPVIQASATGTSLLKANFTGEADVTIGALSSIRYIGSGKITGSGAKPL
ncbi:MAG: DUF2807 domain-containing protein [Mucinivorans sp.]